MKNLTSILAIGAALLCTPAFAEVPGALPTNLDQYGCRMEAANYRCYTGQFAGRAFGSQETMLSQSNAQPLTGNGINGANNVFPNANVNPNADVSANTNNEINQGMNGNRPPRGNVNTYGNTNTSPASMSGYDNTQGNATIRGPQYDPGSMQHNLEMTTPPR